MAKRLREPTLYILAALASGRLHGYALIDAVENLSEGRLKLTAGTLYGALDRLDRDGLIRRDGAESAGGPPRRYYALTPEGRGVLADELQHLEQTVSQLGQALA